MQACCAQEAPQRLLPWQEESLVARAPPQARVRPPALPSSQPQVKLHLISYSGSRGSRGPEGCVCGVYMCSHQ